MLVATSETKGDYAPGTLSYLLSRYTSYIPSHPAAQALRAADIDSLGIFLNTDVEELYLIHRSAPHLQLLQEDMQVFHKLQNWLLHLFFSLQYPIFDPQFWNTTKLDS